MDENKLREQNRYLKNYMDRMENLPTNNSELLQYAVAHYLQNLEYPADKPQLLQQAKYLGAPQEVMETLDRLPEGKFQNADDVTGNMGMMKY